MIPLKQEIFTRRRFSTNVTLAALCCACIPSKPLANAAKTLIFNSEEKEQAKMIGIAKEYLAAACGTYCGACPAYLAKHSDDEQIMMKLKKRLSPDPTKTLKRVPPSNWMEGLLCDGCLSGGMLAAHCQNCAIRKCAEHKQHDARCADCKELPCYRITNLINMGRYLHRDEYLPNLKMIREIGVKKWIVHEEERWRCPKCGLPMRWYDAECVGCGEPRSERLFSLPTEL